MRSKVLLLLVSVLAVSCLEDGVEPPSISKFDPPADGPGALLRIYGAHFGDSTSTVDVIFNGATVSVKPKADTLLVLTIPEGISTGKVQITANKKTIMSEDDFVVLTGRWKRLKDIPTDSPLGLATGFTLGGQGWICGGSTNPVILSKTWKYDAATDTWAAGPVLPVGLYKTVSFTIGTDVYVGAGRTEAGSNFNFYKLAADGSAWTETAGLPALRDFDDSGWSFSAGDLGFMMVTERDNTVNHMRVLAYHPNTDTWEQRGDAPGATARLYALAASANGAGYFGLGSSTSNLKDWWKYNPGTDTWTAQADYPGSTTVGLAAFTIGNSIYVVGDEQRCWEFNTATNAWTQRTSMPYTRSFASAFAIGSKGYISTGSANIPPIGFLQKDLWEFSN
ncbi:MAG: IPT/TIG domain-containing protein [Cyclobacteriaceae bacterium]|nr:IPT/TIG domain-containing protein [Cyclobacteriaceae bacterium]